MKRSFLRFRQAPWLLQVALVMLCFALPSRRAAAAAPQADSYAVVVSKKTQSIPEWNAVVGELAAKHDARVLTFYSGVNEVLPELRRLFPRYVCFVAQPEESTREFTVQVHQITRRFDDDPYADCFWGILTGYDAANALRIARVKEPLTVRKASAGTSIPLELCDEGLWYCELKQNRLVRKEPGGAPVELKGPDDTTRALADSLSVYKADAFVTSGHATERDWQIGYAYKNGYFRCEKGQLYGLDVAGNRFPIVSPNPKVYLAVGNCLMGHIDGRDAMALAFMNSAGVAQMFGYTVNTWYGYAGWGCLDYFMEQPGRFTFTEAFFANQHALIHRLITFFPDLLSAGIDANGRTATRISVPERAAAAGLRAQDGRGLLYDRDHVAFYGDPAWQARMAEKPAGWDQRLTEHDGTWTFEITPRRGTNSFAVLDPNGSQRGGRPVLQYLPRRIGPVTIVEGAEWKPIVTDDFVLVPQPGKSGPAWPCRIVFRAEPLRR